MSDNIPSLSETGRKLTTEKNGKASAVKFQDKMRQSALLINLLYVGCLQGVKKGSRVRHFDAADFGISFYKIESIVRERTKCLMMKSNYYELKYEKMHLKRFYSYRKK